MNLPEIDLLYNDYNAHPRDKDITFREEDHVYTVHGQELMSVTTFISTLFPRFDAEGNARRVAMRKGIPVADILAEWEKTGQESRDLGTLLHTKIERYYQGVNSKETDDYRLFLRFAQEHPLVPYRTEWAIYDEHWRIAGMIDFLDCQNGVYNIYDWKRSAKLVDDHDRPIVNSRYGSRALAPLGHLHDTSYYHYALQLSLYKMILERNYGIHVERLFLGVFHPNHTRPYLVPVPFLETELNLVLQRRVESFIK